MSSNDLKHYIVSTQEMVEIDRRATQEFNIPIKTLMENAGRCVAEKALLILESINKPKPWRVTLFCGSGNNGGDGFVAGRLLSQKEIHVEIYLLKPLDSLKGVSLENFNLIKDQINTIEDQDFEKKLSQSLKDSHLILDCIFGIGLTKEISGPFKRIIEKMNFSRASILAIDIPSGLNGDTGEVQGISIRAKWTVTMGAYKTGLLKENAKKYIGELTVADIGFPDELFKGFPKA